MRAKDGDKTLFNRETAGFQITEQLWWAAVQCTSAILLGMLIGKGADEVRISKLFSMVAGQPAAVEKMALILDTSGFGLFVTSEFIHAAMRKGSWDEMMRRKT